MAADPWPLHSHLELGAFPTAVSCARLHVRQMAWEWGLDGLAETAELLTSEIVTNAVKATAGRDRLLPVRLDLSSDKERLLIEVWDADPRPPVLTGLGDDGMPAPADEGGRGLFLVAALSQRWNWYASKQHSGKVVWCQLQLSAGRGNHGHGPGRPRGRSTARDERPRIAHQPGLPAGGRRRAAARPGERTGDGAAAQAAAGPGDRDTLCTGRHGDPAAGQGRPEQAVSRDAAHPGAGLKGKAQRNAPAGPDDEHAISPSLPEAPA